MIRLQFCSNFMSSILMPKGCLILSFMKIGDKKNFDLEFFKKLRLGKSKKHQRFPPLEKFFWSLILMKIIILNSYGLWISHMKFERNRSRKFFWHRPWPRVKISGETCDEAAVFGVYGKPKIKILILNQVLDGGKSFWLIYDNLKKPGSNGPPPLCLLT